MIVWKADTPENQSHNWLREYIPIGHVKGYLITGDGTHLHRYLGPILGKVLLKLQSFGTQPV